jgi:aspartate oxidase
MRLVFHGVDDLAQLYDLTEDEKRDVDFGQYTADEFLDDMGRVTNYRCDPELTDILIGRSFETLKWMRTKGVRFQPSYGRQAFKVNGKYKFWGGLEHGDRGTRFARRQGRTGRRIARAHHQHIDLEIVHFGTPFACTAPKTELEYRYG